MTTEPETDIDSDGDGVPDVEDAAPADPEQTESMIGVDVLCDQYGDNPRSLVILVPDTDSAPDFDGIWSAKPSAGSCEVLRPGGADFSAVEQKAYDVSGYTDDDITTLYEICVDVEGSDVYTVPTFAAGPEQIKELEGAMVLCPKHPLAATWRKVIRNGQRDARLEKEGRLFWDGTYLVGKEVQPGTYAIEGEVEGCYWERQDRNGGIIDNSFISGARRVQVTIRRSDYAFHAEGCGGWRPSN